MKLNPKQHWIILRLTAILNVPLVLWLVYNIVDLAGADYATFTSWLKNPVHASLLIVTVISVIYHAMLGVHEILEDYVHAAGLLKMSMMLKCAVFFVVGAVCVYSIVKVAFL